MTGPTSVGTVRITGNWIKVTFDHNVRISQAVRQAGGERLSIGAWRVPLGQGTELARRLAPLGLEWLGDAERFLAAEQTKSAAWAVEQNAARSIKAGNMASINWPIQLLPHQQVAAQFLAARSGALLADEQGLGKTVTCLAAYWLVRQADPGIRLVVICPNSLKHTWKSETGHFFPRWTVEVVNGARSARRRSYSARADVYVTNYESVRSDRAEVRLLLNRRPAIVVCDEAHALKNSQAQTTRSVEFLRSAATRMWLLTGTPVPNKVDDIYAQATLADEGRSLGSWSGFKARYGQAAEDPGQLADLQRALDPLILRRTKDEVLDLPDRVFEQRWVELSGRQRSMYDEIRDGLRLTVASMTDAEYKATRQNILVRLLRLSQVASNPRLVEPDFDGPIAKQKEIDDLLVQLIEENGHKVVLWSYYVDTIVTLLSRYKRYRPTAIYGGVDLDSRAAAVRSFQETEGAKLFIGNPPAAGTGLTLTAAPYAIYETLSWRYDLYAQSLDRIHRIGQHRNVTYFEILAADTLDLTMRQRLQEKRAFAGALLGDPQGLPAFGREELLDLLRPNAD